MFFGEEDRGLSRFHRGVPSQTCKETCYTNACSKKESCTWSADTDVNVRATYAKPLWGSKQPAGLCSAAPTIYRRGGTAIHLLESTSVLPFVDDAFGLSDAALDGTVGEDHHRHIDADNLLNSG